MRRVRRDETKNGIRGSRGGMSLMKIDYTPRRCWGRSVVGWALESLRGSVAKCRIAGNWNTISVAQVAELRPVETTSPGPARGGAPLGTYVDARKRRHRGWDAIREARVERDAGTMAPLVRWTSAGVTREHGTLPPSLSGDLARRASRCSPCRLSIVECVWRAS